MLYLNSVRRIVDGAPSIYLTLTNVVFEFTAHADTFSAQGNLTLTNVVFEFCFLLCCILICLYLTLTNVVFE